MLAKMDPLGSTLDLDRLAADGRQWDEAVDPGVAGGRAIVAEEQVAASRDDAPTEAQAVPAARREPWLREGPPVDHDQAATLPPALPGHADHALDVDAAGAALDGRGTRRLEDDGTR